MKKLFAALLALVASVALGATLNPVGGLNPAGSTAGQAVVSTGPSSAPAWGGIGVSSLSAVAANTVLANATGASASPSAFSMPGCSSSTSALQWGSGSGFACNSGLIASGTNNPSLTYTSASSNAVARNFQSRFGDMLSVKDFGATGNGSTNDTTAIQNAISAAEILNKFVFIPAGTYLVSGTLSITSPVGIIGEGMGRTIIEVTATQSVPVISVANAASTAAHSSLFQDFTVTSTVTAISGCDGLQIAGGINFMVERVQASNTYNGINVTQATGGAWIDNCFANNTVAIGIAVDAGNMVVHGSWAINCGTYGFYFSSVTNQSAGLIVTDDTAFNSNAGNFRFAGNATHNIIDLVVANCTSSTSPNGPGFIFDTYGAYITISNIVCELAGMTSADVYVSAQNGMTVTSNNLGAISLNNLMMFGAGASGIEIDCSDFTLNGGYFVNNNQAAGAQNAGVLIGAAGAVHNFVVSGVNTAVPTGTNSQSYGVNSFTSGSTGLVVNSILHGTTGGMNNNGSTVTVANNLTV